MRLLHVGEHATIEGALDAAGFGRLSGEIHHNHLWLVDDRENARLVNATSNPGSNEFAQYVLRNFDVDIKEMLFNRDANIALRNELIRIRDNFQGNRYYKEAIILTHCIGWLAHFVDHQSLE